jgi:hypothetical protein
MAEKKKVEEKEEEKVETKTVKTKKLEGVTVGRNVHFVSSGGVNSLAFITRVHDKETGMVNLFVVRDDEVRDYHFETSVAHSDEKETGTWHFIEKE